MKVTDFDFDLPESLIALRPAIPRDTSRLLVLRRDGSLEHRSFGCLPEYLSEGDLLIMNNTKVFPARLSGRKQSGGKIDILLVKEIGERVWEVLCRERYTGKVSLSEDLSGELSDGKVMSLTVKKGEPSSLMDILWNVGCMPLPPYIKRKPDERDKESYQTVYAERTGSIAAPTAGLHFTDDLLARIKEKGIVIKFLTLHVGTGTFRPVKVENMMDHIMDPELFEIEGDLIETIKRTKRSGKRVISVGTTTTRAIEGFYSGAYKALDTFPVMRNGVKGGKDSRDNHPLPCGGDNGAIHGYTDMFIHPGYRFRTVDSLITNFHLPRSTPLMLTSALRGMTDLLNAYRCAISMKYRFFSYGDAMLIL
jgi:S-adenosylmethionine:tRNA ribosyltransferase-isomerase